ncbi:MAG: hypothetical protein JNJ59_15000 [Deltaproteobacteria bacterium]|nr:hypothetical protein [Deltaproteobacteria bacterium]
MPSAQPARHGRPFDAGRRRRFLELIEQGYSKIMAAGGSGVATRTVAEWLKSGRSAVPRHTEHAKFADEYAIAEAKGTMALYGKLIDLSDVDTKAALALMRARGVPGFGPSAGDQARASSADARLKIAQADRAEVDARMARVRVEVAEAAAKGVRPIPGFGIAPLLADEELPVEVRQAVAAWAVRRGYIAVERKDWDVDGGGAGMKRRKNDAVELAALDNYFMARVRVEVAEAAIRGKVPVDLATLLEDESVPAEVRQVVAAWEAKRTGSGS